MATDPPDLGAIRARHVERPIVLPSGVPATYCPACGSPWPCDAARLYDAQAARLAALEHLLLDWQDHLLRVHRIACDYPLRIDLVDYPGKEEHQEDDQE